MLATRILEHVNRSPGTAHYGAVVREAVPVRAERLVAERLKELNCHENDLATRRKGDPGKVKRAAFLRAHTTMPLTWIATRLAMGSRGYLTWLLQRHVDKT